MARRLFAEHRCRLVSSTCQTWCPGRWRGRRLVAECVSAILLVSVALAYVSPPDPSWIAGIYDDRDYDDVVGMVTDATGVSDSRSTVHLDNAGAVGFLPRGITGRIPIQTARRQAIRSPPIEARAAFADPPLLVVSKTLSPSHVPPTAPGSYRGGGFLLPGVSPTASQQPWRSA
jgi:hypothetical protein